MLTCALPQPLPRSVSGHSYVPQTYFYAPREETPLPIHGTSDSSPHFLHDESTLLWGLEKMIEVVKSGERYNSEGLPERTDL